MLAITLGSFIPRVTKADLHEIRLPMPALDSQEAIANTHAKIESLRLSLDDFESELSLNPDSAGSIQSTLANTLDSIGALNQEDQLFALIRTGESRTVEFKQTFTKDVKTGIKEREKTVRESSLKNIVAFLNSREGGTLLIGVTDDGSIYGIENDYYESDDKYLLNFKNQVKTKIGEDSYLFVSWKIVTVQSKKVLRVDCLPTNEPAFLNETDFYVRINPSTDKLVGKKLAAYLRERFNK